MAKKDDSEFDAWRLRFPSAGVSWNLTGDPAYCQQFVGEAKNMLYRLKNRMNIAVPKLKSLQDKRSPAPGTTIIVKSIFGQDFVEINALRGGFPSCLIKLLDLPETVPPMKWYAPGQETFTKSEGGWVITAPGGETEVEGVDYIKTYYSLSVTACNECQPLALSLCTPDEIASLGTPWAGPKTCRPYTYDATKLFYLDEPVPFFEGFPDRVPPVPPDPKNHLIYSLYESGQAEILKFGSDNQGTYFLWKAYTEWGTYPPTSITFSRTGLGYLLLKAFIQFEGRDLCKAETIIKVDCCLKDVSRRRIQQPDRPGYSGLWWESESGSFPQNCEGQPFTFYGTMKMCEVPSEISNSDLFIMACIPVHPVAFYVLPDLYGSCLPFTWTLEGPGIWTPGGNYGEIGYYGCAEIDCHEEITIHVTDRCGSTATVRAKSCCESAGALSISYTSLLMSCGGQQTFTAIGGCGPYSWAGGSIEFSPPGYTAIYTAPATNPNCTSNPTITVTDCCGNSASISLAVNCSTSELQAVGYVQWFECEGCWQLWSCDAQQGTAYCYDWIVERWNCRGEKIYSCETRPCGTAGPPCTGAPGLYVKCDCSKCAQMGGDCPSCYTEQCGSACAGACTPFVLTDCRTQEMKDEGCCPLNPLTGLPY